eukprot:TRINITY_DN1315_c0_g1_i1.p1 TRINITY_DN1315_c0_g1~~TRINITY_DN1315_c0_g1_i1.p1  ORF type:complete len:509 (-),score=22.43 TRINITY_DN1315_c0_g1_i1:43-1569(-)
MIDTLKSPFYSLIRKVCDSAFKLIENCFNFYEYLEQNLIPMLNNFMDSLFTIADNFIFCCEVMYQHCLSARDFITLEISKFIVRMCNFFLTIKVPMQILFENANFYLQYACWFIFSLNDYVCTKIIRILTPLFDILAPYVVVYLSWFYRSTIVLVHRFIVLLDMIVIPRIISIIGSGIRTLEYMINFFGEGIASVFEKIQSVFISVSETLMYILFPRPCGVCGRGYAKIRSLCFTCTLELFIPHCSDCNRGFAKILSKCFTCNIKPFWSLCEACERGFHKIGNKCFRCWWHNLPLCQVCQRGRAKLGIHCFKCTLSSFVSICSTCNIGYAKLGSLCFTCKLNSLMGICVECRRGYAKIRDHCFKCTFRRFLRVCSACNRGYAKFGPLCITCKLNSLFAVCSSCHRGYSKFGPLCVTCKLNTLFRVCSACNRGYAKFGPLCITCKTNTLFSVCGVCRRGYAKIGTRCASCTIAYIKNPPICGVCNRGYSKIGRRCLTCYMHFVKNSLLK